MNTYAERLKELLEAKKLKQVELADLIDTNPKSINTYVTGRSEPNLETVRLIADKLNVPIEYFFGYITLEEAVGAGASPEKAELVRMIRGLGDEIPREALRLAKIAILACKPETTDLLDMVSGLAPYGHRELLKQAEKELAHQKIKELNLPK